MTEPELTMGTRPDGSPWVIAAEFGERVRVDGYNRLYDETRWIDPAAARARAAALIAAADWVESGRSARFEQAMAELEPNP